MANFCKFCGTPLEEGQVCACQGAQAAPQAAPVATAAPAAPAGNSLINTLKDYWKAPKATAAAVAADPKGMITAGIFAGVNFLAVFFFLWRIIGMFVSAMAEGYDVKLSELEEALEVEYPIFPMLVAGLAIAVIGIVVAALVIFVAAKINKQEADLKKLIVIQAVHTLIPSALLVVGIVLGLLAAWLQFLVLAMILVLWFVNICNDVREVAGVQIMENGKAMVINSLVIFVALAVAVYLMVAIGSWGIGEVSIQGTTMNEAIEDLSDMLGMLGNLS